MTAAEISFKLKKENKTETLQLFSDELFVLMRQNTADTFVSFGQTSNFTQEKCIFKHGF